jgi:hypothetical protein
MSPIGTNRTFRHIRYSVANGGKADNICSQRVFPLLTQLYGPAVRCKSDVSDGRVVLRICIRPVNGAIELLAIMDIRAHPISFCERP